MQPPAGASATGPAGVAAAPPAGAPSAPRPDVTPAAQADFARAVAVMRSGNATEAELGLKQFSLQYPQFAAPLIDLGILYRKAQRLDESEQALRSAVEREGSNAIAWDELGVTQRMRGEFKDAAASYEQAIKADPQFAPPYRNLGVVADLYLADPGRALIAFTRYQELTGVDKPVSGWIAELRQRLKLPPVKKPEASPPPAGAPAGTPGSAPPATPAASPAKPADPPHAPHPGAGV
ncbi:MAG TPA: tetratricopeptide repeat protein [Steroidobacteraceae bacterium]|nr:tetratricopeptide repeat protein [Steroidobacteraceae bacterium]